MAVCHHCRQPILETVERGPLTVTREPPAVYWQGIKQGRLSPMKTAILFLLAQRGTATRLALEMLSAGHSSNAVAVHISHLREWLRDYGIPLRIVAERGVGYRLEAV